MLDERFAKKEQQIKTGIVEILKVKEQLFKLKDYFYGDFKYSEKIKRSPYPNHRIQEAIASLESAIREAELIEINSV